LFLSSIKKKLQKNMGPGASLHNQNRFAVLGQSHRDWLPRKGLEGCGAATPKAGPERVSAEPRKARFFAKQKMRPNFQKESS
jgi:hypothetical protein